MKKKMSVLLLSLLLVSCSNGTLSTAKQEDVTLKDSIGRDVTLNPKEINHVLCIGAGALRLYTYIGDVNKLCAVEDIDRSIDGANPFSSVSRPYYDLNKETFAKLPSAGKGGPKNQVAEAEAILAAKPDIVISEYNDKEAEDALQEKIGVPVFTVSYDTSNKFFGPKIMESLTNLGKIFQREERAKELTDYIEECRNELTSKGKEGKADKKYYVGGLGNWGTQDIYSTSTSFPLFDVSNVPYAVDSVQVTQGTIDKEKLVESNPDVIFLDSAGIEKIKDTYKKDKELLDSLTAFQNNEVYLEMPFNAYYTNVEISMMDAYYIASIVYPEEYKDFSIEDKANEITKKFLGTPCYSMIASMEKSCGGFQKIDNIQEFLA